MSKILLDTSTFKAEVYHYNSNKQIYFIKITIPDLEMYITSLTIRPSLKTDGQWFQMPAFGFGGKWTKPIELPNSSPLLELFERLSFQAVAEYEQSQELLNEEEYLKELENATSKL